MPSKVWGEITYPYLYFNGSATEVWECVSNFIFNFIMGVITYPCWVYSYSMSVKGQHWWEIDLFTVRLFQTPQKLSGFHRTEDRFWRDFADMKQEYTQEFYRSYSSFISQCPRTGKFRGVCSSVLVNPVIVKKVPHKNCFLRQISFWFLQSLLS